MGGILFFSVSFIIMCIGEDHFELKYFGNYCFIKLDVHISPQIWEVLSYNLRKLLPLFSSLLILGLQ